MLIEAAGVLLRGENMRRLKGRVAVVPAPLTEDECADFEAIERLIDFLADHCARPEFTCRFRWEAGSLALWDNRCAMHFAIDDYPGQRRRMRRLTIEGDTPV